MTLYLKYRPQTLDELDLESVRESLKKIVTKGNIPHAFLFAGPKGTGKTSAARILAKIVNCESTPLALRGPGKIEPCNKCSQCLSITKGDNIDVIELDAASHRGIDDIRSLREAVKLAPARAKKKVYIIDEAHMLTLEASNALLKTLEEPPEHVIFILATTNPEKLIETIRSRSTIINFRKASIDETVRSLKPVVKGEGWRAEEGALEEIARASDGSFRDAVKILEQFMSEGGRLEKEELESYLLQRNVIKPEEFLQLLSERDIKSCLAEIERMIASGISAKIITQLLIARLRSALMARFGTGGEDLKYFSTKEVIRLIKLLSRAYREINVSYLEQIPLEMAVVEWGEIGRSIKGSRSTKSIKGANENRRDLNTKDELREKSKIETSESEQTLNSSNSENSLSEEVWLRVLSEIRPRNASTEALLRAAKPIQYDGGVLTLGVYYKFHKERLEANPHREILAQVIESITGNHTKVICTLTEPPVRKIAEDKDPKVSSSILTKSDSAMAASDAVLTETEDEDIIKVAKEIFGQ